jgi:hypothetical protein
VICKHAQRKIVYFTNHEDSLELEICNDCFKIVETRCEHLRNIWVSTCNEEDSEEQKLICMLCGADGT